MQRDNLLLVYSGMSRKSSAGVVDVGPAHTTVRAASGDAFPHSSVSYIFLISNPDRPRDLLLEDLVLQRSRAN